MKEMVASHYLNNIIKPFPGEEPVDPPLAMLGTAGFEQSARACFAANFVFLPLYCFTLGGPLRAEFWRIFKLNFYPHIQLLFMELYSEEFSEVIRM